MNGKLNSCSTDDTSLPLQQQLLSMDFLTDLLKFMAARKKWILAPIIIVLLLLGILIVIGGSSPLAPFVYTLF